MLGHQDVLRDVDEQLIVAKLRTPKTLLSHEAAHGADSSPPIPHSLHYTADDQHCAVKVTRQIALVQRSVATRENLDSGRKAKAILATLQSSREQVTTLNSIQDNAPAQPAVSMEFNAACTCIFLGSQFYNGTRAS